MILYLTDSLKINENDKEEYKNLLHKSLRYLALSAMEGNHYLYGDIGILEDCENMFAEEDIKAFYHHIVYNHPSLAVPEKATYFLEIVRNNPQTRKENECIIEQREIASFSKLNSVEACQFICENEVDCSLYKNIGRWFMNIHNFKAPLKFTLDGCGGCSGAKARIQKHLKENQICLSILDSDKWYPNKSANPNAVDCQRAHKNSSSCRCLILNVRELENLLPLNYVDEAMANNKEIQIQPDRLRDKRHFDFLRHSKVSSVILTFFDYKNGVKKDENFMNDENLRKFAELCWSQNPDINTGITFNDYVDSVEEKGFVYNPLFKRISLVVLNYIEEAKKSGSLPHPSLLDFQQSEWERLGQEIVNWGYACEEFHGAS